MSKLDLKKDGEKRGLRNKVSRKQLRDAKLQELEKQLEFAESRCGTLKKQLYYIKLLYGGGQVNNTNNSNNNNDNSNNQEERGGDGFELVQNKYMEGLAWTNNVTVEKLRNKENGDGIDCTMQTGSQTNSTSTNSSKVLGFSKTVQDKTDESKKRGHGRAKGHGKVIKSKTKNTKRGKKRRKSDEIWSSKFSNVSSQTKSQIWQDPVVEIYKNCASNVESESGLEIICNSRRIRGRDVMGVTKNPRTVAKSSGRNTESEPSKEKISEDPRTKSCNALSHRKETNSSKEEGIQTELSLNANESIPINTPNETINSTNKENIMPTENYLLGPVKSYCQPTISSRRKQVDRDIYSSVNGINVRSIPFIVARSTAPSHNIGVNIQQVLSIIKKRQPLNDNLVNQYDTGNQDNVLTSLLASKKVGSKTSQYVEPYAVGSSIPLEAKKRCEVVRSSLSHWKSVSDVNKETETQPPPCLKGKDIEENQNHEWSFRLSKLKRVLIFLHEDFTSLSQKYKRLQKKLTKRNITKTDAKGELADIERDLEKKEEEIIIVIGLYKEVLNLREELKKVQDKYESVVNGKALLFDGLKPTNSNHTQMTTLLRKIQTFQDQLKA